MATARALRPATVAALRTGFADRGWTIPRSGAERFRLPPVQGLIVQWYPGLAGDAYGGLRFGGTGAVVDDDVTARLLSFPDDALPADVVRWPPGDRAGYCSLAVEAAGPLVDPRGDHHAWVVRTAEEVAPAVEAFFATVDGPMRSWIGSVTPVPVLLRRALAAPDLLRVSEIAMDATAVLALERGHPEIARAVVQGFPAAAALRPSTPQRFEQELAARYPAYGDPQR